jgi:hypothetical protein
MPRLAEPLSLDDVRGCGGGNFQPPQCPRREHDVHREAPEEDARRDEQQAGL